MIPTYSPIQPPSAVRIKSSLHEPTSADASSPPLILRAWPLIAALMGSFLLLFGVQSWRDIKADQIQQLGTVTELAKNAVDRHLEQTGAALGVLADRLAGPDGLIALADAQRLLSDFKTRHPTFVAVNLLGLDGSFLATSATTNLRGLPTVGDQRNFAEIVARQRPEAPMEIAPPLFGPAAQRWILPIRYAIRDRDGRLLAFIIASAPVELLQGFWSEAPVVSRAAIALVRDDGYLLSRYPLPAGKTPADLYGAPRDGAIIRTLRAQSFPRAGIVEDVRNVAGEPAITVFARLQTQPATLLATLPTVELRRLWFARTTTTFVVAALLAGIAIAAYRWLTRRELAWRQEQVRSARQLRESNDFLERAGRVAGVGGWAVDIASGRITWSARTRRIHEVDDHYIPTMESAIAFYAPEARPLIEEAVSTALREGRPWDLELRLITAKGGEVWVRAQGEAEFEGGQPVRLVGAFQDITEYRRRQLELRSEQALREQAEAHAGTLDRMLQERSRMLDVLAHEVRQPLNNASAALQAARSAMSLADPAELGRRVERAQSVLANVLTAIDNTLAAAALLAGTTPLRREDADIGLLLALSTGDLAEDLQARVHVDRGTSTRTAGMDSALMRLALRNLLSNALKYSPADRPVELRVLDRDDPPALVFEVLDRGCGVPAYVVERQFERGVRGAPALSQEGMGLGLSIVKRVVDLHGGSVELQPREGGGTTARVVIPQVEQPA